MTGAPVYNARVRQLFASAEHAGDTGGPAVDLTRGGQRVVLSAGVDGQRVTQLAFRVFGCPHLVAAAESFCDEFEGQPVTDLQHFETSGMLKKLEIPVEKTGRILLLEDAIRALQAEIEARTP